MIAVVDKDGKEINATRRYSADVGQVLKKVTATMPSTTLPAMTSTADESPPVVANYPPQVHESSSDEERKAEQRLVSEREKLLQQQLELERQKS